MSETQCTCCIEVIDFRITGIYELNFVPKRYIEVLTLSSSECDLIWK